VMVTMVEWLSSTGSFWTFLYLAAICVLLGILTSNRVFSLQNECSDDVRPIKKFDYGE